MKTATAAAFAGLPVQLRNETYAEIRTGTSGVPGYPLQGVTTEGVLELWARDGRWLTEAKGAHPRDIVAAIIAGRAVPWAEFLRGAAE